MANILVVDDAKVMRFHISKLLTQLGHVVIGQAKDGYEAIEEFKKNRPDIITMDLEMPTTNNIKGGLGAVEKLIEIDPSLIIIMISSQTDKDNISAALTKGAKNYINKPITSEKLESMITHLGY